MAKENNNLSLMLLQPGYLPWLGFFGQVYKVDIYVVYDDAQYTKQDWRNRNRIKTKDGLLQYLTVPVKKAPVNTLVKDIVISYDYPWTNKHLNLVRENYFKSPYFKDYFAPLSLILSKKEHFLIDLDLKLIHLFMKILGLNRRIIMSSQLKSKEKGKDRLLAACRELGVTRCYNGKTGEALYSKEKFKEHGITLEFQDFKCPQYPQQGKEFIPNLSVIDLLFNCGAQMGLKVIVEGEGGSHG